MSPWLRYSAAVAAASVLAYIVSVQFWAWRAGRTGGLVFGIAASALFVNAGLYPWRRRWRARPLGTAQRWLQLHIYGSVVAMLFVFLHTGFRLPVGTMGWLLLVLSGWTTATGLFGVWLQRVVPILLARRVSVEAIRERIPELVDQLLKEADAVMVGAAAPLAGAYAGSVRPLLTAPKGQLVWLGGVDTAGASAMSVLSGLRPLVTAVDKDRFADLESIVRDKNDLDAQFSLQRLLRVWLVVHVPPAMVLLGLLVVHILAVVWL
jgi:hypothetical protein